MIPTNHTTVKTIPMTVPSSTMPTNGRDSVVTDGAVTELVDGDLHEKLPPGAHGANVVHEPNEMHRERAADHGRQPTPVLGEHVLAIDRNNRGHRDRHREDDRHAADSRDGIDVDFPLAARIDGPRAARITHHVRQCRRRANGDDESDEVQRNLRLLRQQESRLPTRLTTRARTKMSSAGLSLDLTDSFPAQASPLVGLESARLVPSTLESARLFDASRRIDVGPTLYGWDVGPGLPRSGSLSASPAHS